MHTLRVCNWKVQFRHAFISESVLIYLMEAFHLNGGYSAGAGPSGCTLDFLFSFYLNREFHLTQ